MIKITKTSKQCLRGLSEEQVDKIKEALTFNNPSYAKAKRHSRSGYISIPKYLEYFTERVERNELNRENVIEVPIGFNVTSLLECKANVEDLRVVSKVTYPDFLLTMREDQNIAMNSYFNYSGDDYPKCIIHLPTGKGKSILALRIAYELKQKTLILVHKDDLVTGWKKDIEKCFGDKIDCGLIKAKSRKVGKQITIATVQTLGRMSDEELSNYTQQFGLVIQDECHHVGINVFNVIDQFNSKYKLGLSATPRRSDGLTFTFDLFLGGLCYKHKYEKEDNDILPAKVIIKNSKVKYKPFVYEKMVYNYYDFKEEELPDNLIFLEDIPRDKRPDIPFATIDSLVVLNLKHKIMVCKSVLEHYKQGHSCLLLFQFKEEINVYYRYLKRYIPSDEILLYYGDSKESSEVMMDKAESRKCLVTLATFAKATEGTNVKSWEVEFLVSSLKDRKNVEQATGRIRRTKEGKLNPVLIYDYNHSEVYIIGKHLDNRLFTYKALKYDIDLEGEVIKPKRRGKFSRGYL